MQWLNSIAYTYIGNYPVIMYLGIITFISLLVTAAMPRMNRMGWTRIPLKYHIRMAYLTAVLAAIHGLLAISGYF